MLSIRESGYVESARALGAGDDLELDLVTFSQGAEAIALDRGLVDEDVLAAVVWLNEAKAFLGVEPFHCAGGH